MVAWLSGGNAREPAVMTEPKAPRHLLGSGFGRFFVGLIAKPAPDFALLWIKAYLSEMSLYRRVLAYLPARPSGTRASKRDNIPRPFRHSDRKHADCKILGLRQGGNGPLPESRAQFSL